MSREKLIIWGAMVGIVALIMGTFWLAHESTTKYRENVARTPDGGATRSTN